jgi:hypothetical protein
MDWQEAATRDHYPILLTTALIALFTITGCSRFAVPREALSIAHATDQEVAPESGSAVEGSDEGEKGIYLSGPWDLTIQGPQGRRALALFLNQRGAILTGRIEDRIRSGSVPVHGTLAGDSITFSAVVYVFGRTVEEHFTGTIAENSMSGTLIIDTVFMSDRRGDRQTATHQHATWTARRSD